MVEPGFLPRPVVLNGDNFLSQGTFGCVWRHFLVATIGGEVLPLRQEIDGPQAEQLELVPCGQILQDEDDSWNKRS